MVKTSPNLHNQHPPAPPRGQNIDDLLPSDLLNENEEVVFAVKPSLWTIAFLSFRTTLLAVVIVSVVSLLGPRLSLGRWGGYVILFCGIVVLGRIGFAFLQWLSRSYVLTDRRVIRIRGVFTIDIFQCTLARIQNTFLVLTLPQRLLSLGNIAFTTAGTGRVEAIWRHIRNPLKIHNQLMRAINAAASDPQSQSTNQQKPV